MNMKSVWSDICRMQGATKKQRQALYKILCQKPEKIKRLVRNATIDEAHMLLDTLARLIERDEVSELESIVQQWENAEFTGSDAIPLNLIRKGNGQLLALLKSQGAV